MIKLRLTIGLLVAVVVAIVAGTSLAMAQAATPTTALSSNDDAATHTPAGSPLDNARGQASPAAAARPAEASTRFSARSRDRVVAANAGADGAATVGRDAAESCLNSFTGNTPVTMADGTTEPIKDIKVEDKVLATDPITGQTKAEPVVQLIRHSGKHAMVLISLADGSVLDSTDGHPIWDSTTGRFTDAGKLHVGDRIETSNGSLITIAGLTTYSADLTAYNLQIDQIHTYYAGTTPVLVHNSCGPDYHPRVRRGVSMIRRRTTSRTHSTRQSLSRRRRFRMMDRWCIEFPA